MARSNSASEGEGRTGLTMPSNPEQIKAYCSGNTSELGTSCRITYYIVGQGGKDKNKKPEQSSLFKMDPSELDCCTQYII